jgi:hypothetical protein
MGRPRQLIKERGLCIAENFRSAVERGSRDSAGSGVHGRSCSSRQVQNGSGGWTENILYNFTNNGDGANPEGACAASTCAQPSLSYVSNLQSEWAWC